MSCWQGLRRAACVAVLGGTLAVPATAAAQGAGVSVEQILQYRPVQPGVEIETPTGDDIKKCKVEVERSGKASGWITYGPNGQILRRFIDTDGDNVVDQWRYYQHGLEVYRDIDTNGNNEVDQSRWLNMQGTRWGIDSNEDGKIDRWLRISAEEASREAIRALAANDPAVLAPVMFTAQDGKALGLREDLIEKLSAASKNIPRGLQETLSKAKKINRNTRWVRFDSSLLMPNLVPKESGKADRDLLVYENVMTIVETDGETGFVQIGEMVQVGDVWKLTSLPVPLDGTTIETIAAGGLMEPDVATLTSGAVQLSPEVQALIRELEQLDQNPLPQNATREQMAAANQARAKVLRQLAQTVETPDDRELWQRQWIDVVAAATQMDSYPGGLDELKAFERELRQKSPESGVVPYIVFNRLATEYNAQLRGSDSETRGEVQEGWIKTLESFVADYPESESASDALLQLAVNLEFLGRADEAKSAYQRLLKDHPQSFAAQRGSGAVRRLELAGKPLTLSGTALGGGNIDVKSYQGKVLAVVFWATWCRPCTEELPQLIELYRQHRAAGFEVIGVNLDSPGAPIQQYVQQHKVPWPHIAEEGGLESRPAREFGIITLPTMFLVDRQGRVANAAASLDDIKEQLPELLKAK